MQSPLASPRCRRAHEWVSLRADGELSQFEEVLLDAHVADCEPCRQFVLSVSATTAELRRAPLEPLARPVTLPPRRRALLRPLSAGAAAAAAAAAGLVAFLVLPQDQAVQRAGDRLPAYALIQDEQQLRDVQRELAQPSEPRPRVRIGHIV